tara:strand:+ start:492 stop:857 length:366 start_codon:yes stop_codon:yes gene_type:complete
MKDEKPKYLTISKVAQNIGLINQKTGKPNTHTIRFWEKNFKEIKPKKILNNRRYYDHKNVLVLKKIKYLLKDQGLTINGAKKILNNERSILDESINNNVSNHINLKLKISKISKLVKNLKK